VPKQGKKSLWLLKLVVSHIRSSYLPWRLRLLCTGKSQSEPFDGGVELQFDEASGLSSDVGRHGNKRSVTVHSYPHRFLHGDMQLAKEG
jgi:hypothetical protein